MADADAWLAARDLVAVGRARCLLSIAKALRCTVEQLPLEISNAVRNHGHDAFALGMRYAHEAPTIPPRPTPREPSPDEPTRPGEYRHDSDEVTRVERPRRRG